jgi:hypothetical protein
MAIKHIIFLFVETPRKFITAVINLRGVSTNKTIVILGLVRRLLTAGKFVAHAPDFH